MTLFTQTGIGLPVTRIVKEGGQYLHGDYDILDPFSACHGIQTGNVETWVGIARQNFISFSLGTYRLNQS